MRHLLAAPERLHAEVDEIRRSSQLHAREHTAELSTSGPLEGFQRAAGLRRWGLDAAPRVAAFLERDDGNGEHRDPLVTTSMPAP
ncbi:hypothetical protein ACQUSR_28530 [Streptomyces sp. P1-3]|uniref:hypothetical protein n=1 Tax=Streptomyces sp. P1-3 TaxID=3421658 RepID=UPI003D363D8A